MPSIELERVVIGTSNESILRLYDELQADLHGYAVAVTRDLSIAEDLVQESFLRLLREHRAGHPPTDPRGWLFRVCTNLVRSRFRRKVVADRNAPMLRTGDIGESAEEAVLRSDDRQHLQRALAMLPEELRMALMLSAEGFSGREIASTLGRSEGATRTMLWRGRTELRRHLSREGER